LDPEKVTPKQLLQHVRHHWQVENCLHFIKDRWWDEDRHLQQRPGLAERWAALTNVALTRLELAVKNSSQPIRALADSPAGTPSKPLISWELTDNDFAISWGRGAGRVST
jgi:hypothetical protein